MRSAHPDRTALAVLAACVGLAGWGHAASLSVEFERGAFEVGDPVDVHVVLEAPAGARVDAPVFSERFGPFDVLALQPVVVDSSGPSIRRMQRLTVAAYRPGPTTMPPLTATLLIDGREVVVASDSVRVDVLSVLESAGADSTADIVGLKAPIDLPVPRSFVAWVAGALVLAAVVALLAWRRRRRQRGRAATSRPIDTRPPDVRAVDELERLASDDLPAAGAFQEHYTRLTDILRPYLERRFRVRTLDRTSHEIFADLRALPAAELDAQHRGTLTALFDDADLAKFAKHRPAAAKARGDVDVAIAFVRDTARSRAAGAGALTPEVGA